MTAGAPVHGPVVIGSIDEVVVDCARPGGSARSWADVLGGEPVERDEDWWCVVPPGWTQLSFQRVPEARTGKDRLHLDVRVEDVEAAAAQVEALGARRVGGVQRVRAGAFQVLLDPEGDEWCAVRPA